MHWLISAECEVPYVTSSHVPRLWEVGSGNEQCSSTCNQQDAEWRDLHPVVDPQQNEGTGTGTFEHYISIAYPIYLSLVSFSSRLAYTISTLWFIQRKRMRKESNVLAEKIPRGTLVSRLRSDCLNPMLVVSGPSHEKQCGAGDLQLTNADTVV